MFDALVAADLSVDDPDESARQLVDVLGLPESKPSWTIDVPGQFKVHFLRPNHRRVGAPTYLEVIGPHPEGGYDPWFTHLHALQGARPMKTHSMNFAVPEPLELVERFRSLGVQYRLGEAIPDEESPYTRLFVGQSPSDPNNYDPTFDAGLMIEFVPTWALALRDETVQSIIPEGLASGAPIRVASRAVIVGDLDATVATLEHYLDLAPSRYIDSPIENIRVAVYEGSIASSARFEIMSPVGDGPVADHLAQFGDGHYRVAMSVNGLSHAVDRLVDRGIGFSRGDDALYGERVSIAPHVLGGLLIDLVEC